jgi:hypothetical protein
MNMAVITFDTLKFVETLKIAGVKEAEARAGAEALTTALNQAMESQLATRMDIHRIEREMMVIKWMTGATFAGVVALLMKML